MTEAVQLLTPVGRLVAGDLYEPNTEDATGRPLVVKTGANAGKSREDWFFALAIPKGSETRWTDTPWGKTIWDVAVKAWPNGQYQSPAFAWKVEDGDSTVPNKRGRRNVDREGYPRHWILKFSSGYQSKLVNANGTAVLLDPGVIKPGHYIQVFGSVAGNNSTDTPGVFLNHSMVAHSGFGPEIQYGPDPASVGFGSAPLPAGASAAPVGGMTVTGAAASLPPMHVPPVVVQSVPAAAVTASPPPLTVVPNHQFVAGPGAPPPPAPPAPPAPARRMLPAAGGATYEAMIQAGWNDALLVQHGMMAA